MRDLQATIDEMRRLLTLQKQAQLLEGPPNADIRIDRIKRAISQLHRYRQAICKAVSADFGTRCSVTSTITEILVPSKHAADPISQIRSWMQREPRPCAKEPGSAAVEAWIEYQPLGVIGILSPWNTPINLTFSPLIGVLSAGNRALIKPSELTPRCSDLIAKMVAEVFDEREVAVVAGGRDVGEAFCRLPFDHLVFTGGTEVGKQVMRAAAENLVPVTLELGGKSPVVIGNDVNIEAVAEKIITAKLINAGQVCLSPDWVLVPADQTEAFILAVQNVVAAQYPTLRDNDHYTAIVNEGHLQRIQHLLSDARAKGARLIEINPAAERFDDRHPRKIPPTLVLNVSNDMAIMNDEIFGPLMIVKSYTAIDAAIAEINARPRPLALYYFGNDVNERDRVVTRTISGGVTVNDIMKHAHQSGLPFGGVGHSGMGAYHDFDGFKNFSHAKPVLVQSEAPLPAGPMKPPYDEQTYAALDQILERMRP